MSFQKIRAELLLGCSRLCCGPLLAGPARAAHTLEHGIEPAERSVLGDDFCHHHLLLRGAGQVTIEATSHNQSNMTALPVVLLLANSLHNLLTRKRPCGGHVFDLGGAMTPDRQHIGLPSQTNHLTVAADRPPQKFDLPEMKSRKTKLKVICSRG